MTKRLTSLFLSMLLVLAAAGVALADEAAPAAAPAIPTSATASVSYMSEYVWRGLVQTNAAGVIQPSIDFNYGGFNANLWSSYNLGHSVQQMTETDLTLKYTYSIKDLSLSAGYIYYGTQPLNDEEAFVSASYATILNPSITYYQDLRLGHGGGFAVLALNQTSPELWHGITVGGGLSAGYDYNDFAMGLTKDGKKYAGFYNGELTTFINFPVTKAISIKPSLTYDFPLTKDASYIMKTDSQATAHNDHNSVLWGGVTVAVAF